MLDMSLEIINSKIHPYNLGANALKCSLRRLTTVQLSYRISRRRHIYGSAFTYLPDKFLHLHLYLVYWFERVRLYLLCIKYMFSTMILYNVVSCLTTDCHCGPWSHGLAIFFLYISPNFIDVGMPLSKDKQWKLLQFIKKGDITKTLRETEIIGNSY